MSAPADSQAGIDRRRYRRLVRTFARIFGHLLWHDVLLAAPPLALLRSEPLPRWRGLARRYRDLAVAMGGVLIKLGQYLSTRVDVLPMAVVEELAGLQDEVPAAPFAEVVTQIEEDFARPVSEIFAELEPVALGAASLAQVHRARLPDGEEVVVKVLRPGIDVLVETDLAAIARVVRWLRWWRFVRRRIDLDWLIEEFTTTTRAELDLPLEGRNAERFAADFADDPQVRFPRIVWTATAARTLTQENVAYLKVSDHAGLEAAGIDRRALAAKLWTILMRMLFVHHFVHADPHPGNLFVRPLPAAEGDGAAPAGSDFAIYLVDFGMVAEIPPRLRDVLRRFLVGVIDRDAAAVVSALKQTGSLLPGADLVLLEEAVEGAFERFWGLDMAHIQDAAFSDLGGLWREFGQVIAETPIQIQVDMMFAIRALELLNGLALSLDPAFDPWPETVPFARRIARDLLRDELPDQLRGAVAELRSLVHLPSQLQRTAALAQRGRLGVRASLAPDTRRQVERLRSSIDRLGMAVLTAGAAVGGAIVFTASPRLSIVFFAVAGLGFAATLVSRFLR